MAIFPKITLLMQRRWSLAFVKKVVEVSRFECGPRHRGTAKSARKTRKSTATREAVQGALRGFGALAASRARRPAEADLRSSSRTMPAFNMLS
jgi:hypothetical protein